MNRRRHRWAIGGRSSSMARQSDRPVTRDRPKCRGFGSTPESILGLARFGGARFGLGRPPGDIVVERGGLRLYIPFTTSPVVGIALSGAFWFFNR
jgi:hypothetical protein